MYTWELEVHVCNKVIRKWIYKGLTLDVDRHYIGSATVTTHQEKGITTLESNPSLWTALIIPTLQKCIVYKEEENHPYRKSGEKIRDQKWHGIHVATHFEKNYALWKYTELVVQFPVRGSTQVLLVIFTLGRPSTLTPEDGDTRVGLSQSKKCTVLINIILFKRTYFKLNFHMHGPLRKTIGSKTARRQY